ncbi:hypothetical protein DFH09DRAFT_1404085 [Mycena vulgaris]|nr:hypothetical protein DFH09DRAFT_1404085 [Mycena vulgaris]
MPKDTSSNTPKLAARSGRWITQTDALKLYKSYGMGASDLASILPVSDEPNPRHYKMRMKTYNVADVEALARRLKSSAASSYPVSRTASGLAIPNGSNIMRTTAMKEFGLSSPQMDRLVPVKVVPNPHPNSKGPMRLYNRCDVKALADSVKAAAASPNGNASRQVADYEDNVFDGVSGENAAYILAGAGAIGPAQSYWR